MTDTVDDADFVVVNTCGFIDSAREESLGAIDEMLALKRPGQDPQCGSDWLSR